VLRAQNIGEVSGAGTLQGADGEIESFDIDLELLDSSPSLLDWLVAGLEKLGAPKGSKLFIKETAVERPLGQAEGMAIYLNGTDLDPSVYSSCDLNLVISACEARLGGNGRRLSYWEGPKETALYFYGASFAQMKALVDPFLATYPLCQKCRIVPIA